MNSEDDIPVNSTLNQLGETQAFGRRSEAVAPVAVEEIARPVSAERAIQPEVAAPAPKHVRAMPKTALLYFSIS